MLRENWFLKLKRMLVVATRRKSIVSISFSTEYLELLWAVQTWLVYTIWCVASCNMGRGISGAGRRFLLLFRL